MTKYISPEPGCHKYFLDVGEETDIRYREQMNPKILLSAIFLFLCAVAFSQEQYPRGFRSIILGMDLEEVKEELQGESYFNYRGDPDVSLLPEPNRTMVQAEGVVFINWGYFQFYEETLYIITLELNGKQIDYFSMYTRLVEKYGEPVSLDNTKAIWEDETVRLSLEKPLMVKYIKRDIFNDIVAQGKILTSASELSRDTFLDQF